MKFTIPDRVKIRGRWWLVKRNNDIDGMHAEQVAGHPTKPEPLLGLMLPKVKVIQLSRRIYGTRDERVTFLHELVHACSHQKIPMAYEERLLSDVDNPLLNALESLEWE